MKPYVCKEWLYTYSKTHYASSVGQITNLVKLLSLFIWASFKIRAAPPPSKEWVMHKKLFGNCQIYKKNNVCTLAV